LNRLGVVGSDGQSPLTWSDLNAWNNFVNLDYYELEIIHSLSVAYADQVYKSRESNCPPPFIPVTEKRKDIDSQLKKMFRQLAKKNKRKKNGLRKPRI